MDEWAKFIALAQESHDFFVYSSRFFLFAVSSQLEDEELRKLYRIGASYNGPCVLPDTTGLNWRETMLKCVEFKRPRSGTPPYPVPNQRPTADGNDDPAVTSEPAPGGATEPDITPEPEVFPAELKFESGVPFSDEAVGVKDVELERSPAHPPVTESESIDNYTTSQLFENSILDFPISTSLSLPHPLLEYATESPSLPSLNPTKSAVLPELSPISPATPPSPPLSDVVTSRDHCEPSPPGCKDPVAPPPTSVPVSPPQPVDLTPSPTLLPPSSSAGTFEPSAARSCLGSSTSPGSDVTPPMQRTYGPSVALRPSTPTAPASSALPQASSPPSVAPATPQPSGSLHPPRMVVAVAPSRSPGSSSSSRSICRPSVPWVPLPSPRLPSFVPKVAPRHSPPWLLPSALPPPMYSILVGDWASIRLILQLHRPPPEPPPAYPFGCSSMARGRALPEGGSTVTTTGSRTTLPSIPSALHLHVITITRT
ncbi:hypothetical protein DPX16_8551 [Anabarilius grahami]|uniref:Uncharacterized protein n=1 Tax=Anabarilius grahami TaxID=495550 RepID=A0A3N0Y990_ANAGA|nr:hypothetical protein DPX16_8551 [Anabarilius grahami]